jgi:23S rRNA pseudouridine1911/1915/1917 synthase
LVIPANLAGERVDKIVAQLAGISRQSARALIDGHDEVTVDGRQVTANERVSGGVLAYPIPPPRVVLAAEHVPFGVVYEDSDLVVVDKPAGVVVHPGAGHEAGTLVGGLLERFPELEGVGQADRWGLVHRLDKETSGLLLVARNQVAYQRLVAALAARRIHRRYQALVRGVMEMPTGTIDAPIGRDSLHPTRKRVTGEGKPARTHYRLLASYDRHSLLELTLETGRTHQIRVHLAAIDHPVVGDRVYNRKPESVAGRMFLHAAELEFEHPSSATPVALSSPLPAELLRILERLGSLPA